MPTTLPEQVFTQREREDQRQHPQRLFLVVPTAIYIQIVPIYCMS